VLCEKEKRLKAGGATDMICTILIVASEKLRFLGQRPSLQRRKATDLNCTRASLLRATMLGSKTRATKQSGALFEEKVHFDETSIDSLTNHEIVIVSCEMPEE
jgi:hypothetical protein